MKQVECLAHDTLGDEHAWGPDVEAMIVDLIIAAIEDFKARALRELEDSATYDEYGQRVVWLGDVQEVLS